MLTNILSFSSNVAALSSSYFVMDDDTTNYFEKEHFKFLLHDTFFTNCTSLKVLFLDRGVRTELTILCETYTGLRKFKTP